MNQKEKPEKGAEKEKDKEIKKLPEEKPEIGEESAWSKDQQEKSYYYDDSYGYEVYVPDEEE